MTTSHLILMIAVAGAVTFATRLFPFALFGQSKEVPKFIKYLGNVLPVAILGNGYVIVLSQANALLSRLYTAFKSVSITIPPLTFLNSHNASPIFNVMLPVPLIVMVGRAYRFVGLMMFVPSAISCRPIFKNLYGLQTNDNTTFP